MFEVRRIYIVAAVLLCLALGLGASSARQTAVPPLSPLVDAVAALEFLGPAGRQAAARLRLTVVNTPRGLGFRAELPKINVEWDGLRAQVAGQAEIVHADGRTEVGGLVMRIEALEADGLELPPGLFPLELRGSGVYAGDGFELALTSDVRLADMEVASGLGVSGPARLEVTAQGGVDGPLRADMVLKPQGVRAAMGGWSLENVSGRVELTAKADGFEAPWSVDITHMAVTADAGGAGQTLPGVKLEGSGQVLPQAQMDVRIDGPLTAKGEYFDAGKAKILTLDGLEFGVQEVLKLLGAEADGWLGGGRVSGRGRLVLGGEPRGELSLAVSGGEFVSPDGLLLGQKLRARALVRMEHTPQQTSAVYAEVAADRGEVLFDTLYADLGKSSFAASLQGVLPSGFADVSLRDVKAELDAAGFGHLSATGTAGLAGGQPKIDLSLRLTDVGLGKVSGVLFPPLPGQSTPSMALAGSAAANARVRGTGAMLDVSGRVRMEGSLEPYARAMKLDLPVEYRLGRTVDEPERQPPEWGLLELSGLLLPMPGAEVAEMNLPVAVVPNRLLTGGEVVLPLLGGRVTLADVSVDEPLSAPVVRSRALLEDLDLGRLPGGIVLSGNLSGELDPIELTPERLVIGGGLTGQLFGGELEVTGLGAERPLSSTRAVFASASLLDMDLLVFSTALGIGEITGRMDVDLNDLVIAYDQPVGFALTAKTEKTKGVDQTISLKAINSLSVLGTGSGFGDAGVGFFASMLKRFPYKAMGLACRLDNDIFTVRGLIHQGGVEYIVKKPLMFGVNVVNSNPSNRIRFSDMLDRLSRVLTPDAGQTGSQS